MLFPSRQLVSSLALLSCADAFFIHPQQQRQHTVLHSTTEKPRPRSRVSDPTGPTPSLEPGPIETIKTEDIPEHHYDPDKHPVAHQPWRRGETAGCEDPIDAAWRVQAQDIIQKAVELTTMSGDGTGKFGIDVTWYLTHLVITLDDDWGTHVPKDFIKTHGPVIDVEQPESPIYKDPADPNPEDIWEDDEDISYQRDEETEEDLKSKTYVRQEDGEEGLGVPEEEPVPLYASQESREDDAVRVAEDANLLQLKEERALDVEALKIDTMALSLLAGAIMDALETVEDELKVLERHELILASRGAQDVLETQTQFDSRRGYDVAVETQDPWGSNRTLRGKLVDRNAMDVIINQKGRMITVPLNFVKCVRLPQTRRNSEADIENGFDMEEDEDIYEE